MSDHLEPTHSMLAKKLAKPGDKIIGDLTPSSAHLLHMAIGVSGESGELLDAIKKFAIYKKPLDRENVVEEIGDIYFYLQGLMNELMIGREEVIISNINKLNTRYPSGSYDNKDAQTRADKE